MMSELNDAGVPDGLTWQDYFSSRERELAALVAAANVHGDYALGVMLQEMLSTLADVSEEFAAYAGLDDAVGTYCNLPIEGWPENKQGPPK